MFVGRQKELNKLNRMYESNRFEMAVLYGRRRIGKTHLINECMKDKKCIYFTAYEASLQENLDGLAKEVWAADERSLTGMQVTGFEVIFDKVYEMAKEEPLMFVIDEYPYLAEVYPTISSILQKHIDRQFKPDTNLTIILSGSSMSFMEEKVLGYKSPLFGRRTAQFKLQPFSIWETKEFLKGRSNEEVFQIHAISGGIPLYVELLSQYSSIKEGIMDQFLDDTGYLYQENRLLLTQELREPTRYNSIIRAVAEGATKRNEIAQKSGVDYNQCGQYLTNLEALDIVGRETPLFEKKGRKSIYIIKDSFFRYWYQIVPKNLSSISRGRTNKVWGKIQQTIDRELGKDFEILAKEWCYENQEELLFEFKEIGRWWGSNPKKKRQEEIDLIACEGKKAIFMECKYQENINIEKVYRDLVEKSELFHKMEEKSYILFLKKSSSKELENARIITLECMLQNEA